MKEKEILLYWNLKNDAMLEFVCFDGNVFIVISFY